MGTYVNTGNDKFRSSSAKNYIDKTDLIHVINGKLSTDSRCMLVTRPRRFGKSMNAGMLSAYYGYGYDSEGLFRGRKIEELDPGLSNINSFNVINIDLSQFWFLAKEEQESLDEKAIQGKGSRISLNWISFLKKKIIEDLVGEFSESILADSFLKTLENAVKYTGRQFLWICDEWDLFFREKVPDRMAASNYLELLRGLFKTENGYTERVFAGAYMTGILPMKRIQGQSAISSFDEYSMFTPADMASYFGFTRDEVKEICAIEALPLDEMIRWYDGYQLGNVHSIFNPSSIREVMRTHIFQSYWTKTSAFNPFALCIQVNERKTRDAIYEMLKGNPIGINTRPFKNDLAEIETPDEVLTAMVHLGYLCYDYETGTVRIPNQELRLEFIDSLKEDEHSDTLERIRSADALLEKTWAMDSQAVAAALDKAHNERADPKSYNSEARLSEAIHMAYYTAKNHYVALFELGSGTGYADIAFVPKPGKPVLPMIVELKWNKPTRKAITQILEKNYFDKLKAFSLTGEILLVGVTYNANSRGKNSKAHNCEIKKINLSDYKFPFLDNGTFS